MRFLYESYDLTTHIIFYQLRLLIETRPDVLNLPPVTQLNLVPLLPSMFDLHGTEENKSSMSEVDKFPKLLKLFLCSLPLF